MNIHDACEQVYRNGYQDGLKDAIKRGEWIQLSVRELGFFYKCSVCGHFTPSPSMKFCLNCGADMRNESEVGEG